MSGNSYSVAVIGAGPAGLAAALALARDGHHVEVIERFERPAPVGSGLILQPTGLAVLHSLGLLDDILNLGARINRLCGVDALSGRTVLDVSYAAGGHDRFGLAVHRAALFNTLFHAVQAAGIALRTGITVTGVDVSVAQASVVSEPGAIKGRYDLVVDASGRGSRLRAFCHRPAEPRSLPYGAFWATLPWHGHGFNPHALLQRYQGASVMIGVLPIGRPTLDASPMAAFFWSLKPEEAHIVRAQGLPAWKARLLALWPETVPYLDAIHDFDQLTLARYGHHTLAPPTGERIAFIGDAAHSTSPQLGQGANMALLDAAALASALRDAPSVTTALDLYAKRRRRHVALFQAMSRLFTPFYQSDSRVLPFLRDGLVATLARLPPVQRLLAATVTGILLDPLAAIRVLEPDWKAWQSREHPLATGTQSWQRVEP